MPQKYRTEKYSMKKINVVLLFVVVFALSMVMFSTVSSAYLDPSAVTFIWQAVAGIVVVCAGSLSFNFKKIVRLFKNGKNNVPKDIESLDSLKDGFDDSEFDLSPERQERLAANRAVVPTKKKHPIDDAFDENVYAAIVCKSSPATK